MDDNPMPLSQAKIQIGSRSGTRIFLVSLVNSGPPWWTVTQESGPIDSALCERINRFANMHHFNESGHYIPHKAYDIATRIADMFRGKVIWFDTPEPGDSPDDSGAVM